MTVLSIQSSTEEQRSRQFFIRIENFPPSASHRDVKKFFAGLSISAGGIFIRGSNAFVSFEQWMDMSAAMAKDGHSIYDHKVLLSIVELKEVQEICTKNCPRNLQFESTDQQPPEEVLQENSPERLRKIRPTAVGCSYHSFTRDSKFAPKEVETEAYSGSRSMNCTTCRRLCSTPVEQRRKIKPTTARCIIDCTSAFMQTLNQSTLLTKE